LLKLVVTNEKLILVGLDRFDLDFGALFSYGNDFKGVGRQSAAYIDRVFHGANIAKMPVLQPTQLELVLNQKIAIQIGYKFSNDEIATADESIN
jgi:putative ABC transport system substrate-binding protein